MKIMMDREINELTEVLKAEQKLFTSYLEKLTEQQNNLIENNLQGLKESIKKINLLAQEAMTLESGRKNIIDRISKNFNIDEDNATLSDLLGRFRGHNFDELEKLKDAILDIHLKATAQKERNELLINQSMSVIKQTVDYMNERKNPKAIYENPAKNGCYASNQGGMLTRTA